jgi:hypothetical protein
MMSTLRPKRRYRSLQSSTEVKGGFGICYDIPLVVYLLYNYRRLNDETFWKSKRAGTAFPQSSDKIRHDEEPNPLDSPLLR